eukprot:m.86125 g.86125  ORF g.86125 m.86125 type:complete len:116 (+) comp50905_c0_seq1:521-868(+)
MSSYSCAFVFVCVLKSGLVGLRSAMSSAPVYHSGTTAGARVGIIVFLIVMVAAAVIGCIFIAPKTNDVNLTRTMIVSTVFCVYIFWLCTYMSQLNPLVYPELKVANVFLNAPSHS